MPQERPSRPERNGSERWTAFENGLIAFLGTAYNLFKKWAPLVLVYFVMFVLAYITTRPEHP